MLFVLQLAFGIFGSNPISELLRGLIAYLPNIFVAILILVIAAAIARAVTDLLSSLLGAVQGGQLLARGAGIAILVFAAFAALDQLQIAPRIVTGLWYALLAAVVGPVIVAVGGGGIRPRPADPPPTTRPCRHRRAPPPSRRALIPGGGPASGGTGSTGPRGGVPQATSFPALADRTPQSHRKERADA